MLIIETKHKFNKFFTFVNKPSKINMKNLLLLAALVATVLMSCEPAAPKIEEIYPNKLDLMEYGVPYTLQTPTDFEVVDNSLSILKDLTIEGTDYKMIVYGKDASNPNTNALANTQLGNVKNDTYIKFSKLIRQDNGGFLYELQAVGDTTKAYNFHYFITKGDKEYHFTSSAGGRRPPFTLEQMTNMYLSVLREQDIKKEE
jgi:hypothetical protein